MKKVITGEATYLLVIFDHPGPSSPGAELKSLIPYLTQHTTFKPAKDCKYQTVVGPVENETDFTRLEASMIHWLRKEGERGEPVLNLDIERGGFNAGKASYKFFHPPNYK